MFYPEQVPGYIIYLGGRKILHIGDAEMRIENWQIFDFKSRKIDVVLISFWLFKAEITRKIIYEQIAPKKVIVNQILQSDSEKEVSELSVKFPDVIFVNKPMVSTEF